MKAEAQAHPPLLLDVLPTLGAELIRLFESAGRGDLAAQVPSLRVRSRCDCGDDFCATIYVRRGRPFDCITFDAGEGMINVDVDAQDRITGIEILYRDEYKRLVDQLFSRRRAAGGEA